MHSWYGIAKSIAVGSVLLQRLMPRMSIKKYFRNLIIGRSRYVSSYGEFKQAMLSGNMALMGIAVCIIYIIAHLYRGATEAVPVLAITIVPMVLSIYLHRIGRHRMANFFLLPSINIAVFLFASSESIKAGTFVFYISNAVAAFAIFSHRERHLAIVFSFLTYLLFVAACVFEFELIPRRNYGEEMILFNVIVNFSVALPATVMSVNLLINLNHYNGLQLLERNDQLKKTNTELDRFVYSTSHDLRAPLTSLMGLINITSNTNDPSEFRKYLMMMKDRVHSLDKFIKDITDYSRNNRLEITHEKVKLVALAEEVWESLKFTPEAGRISFHIDIPEGIEVDSDKNRLKVIVSNLISNAIRYHDERKEQQYIRLHADVHEKAFYLKIEDNGQGIASEYHTKIFEMFYRANEQSKGSGLGLYIVKEALMKLSGTIHLESAPGIGSTFTIKLPTRLTSLSHPNTH
jgi:signal transduction histidine kinase